MKFRVWDKANKEWATDFVISLDGELLPDDGGTLFTRDNFILLRDTGFKDNNDSLIFEGDVLLIDGQYNYCAVYSEEHGSWLFYDEENEDTALWEDIANYSITIAGNIYESPQLVPIRAPSP